MPIAITPPVVEAKDASSTTVNMKIPLPEHKQRKIICFSDFDGTIALQDTGHILFDNHGCGSARRKVLNEEIETGKRSFREVSEEMYASLNVPFEDGFEVMEEQIQLDPDFEKFHAFCIKNSIPFNVISAGLKPILRRILDGFLGEEASSHIDIVANDATISQDGAEWKPIWRHDDEMGHNKSVSMTEARQGAELECEDGSIPLIVFIGDGVSDLPAARHADVLFARRGLKLEDYCIENKISYIAYDSFADIQKNIERIMKEDAEKTRGMGTPALFNPRANMWRRVSSKNAIPRMVLMTPSKEERMFLWPEAFSAVTETTLEIEEPAEVAVPAA